MNGNWFYLSQVIITKWIWTQAKAISGINIYLWDEYKFHLWNERQLRYWFWKLHCHCLSSLACSTLKQWVLNLTSVYWEQSSITTLALFMTGHLGAGGRNTRWDTNGHCRQTHPVHWWWGRRANIFAACGSVFRATIIHFINNTITMIITMIVTAVTTTMRVRHHSHGFFIYHMYHIAVVMIHRTMTVPAFVTLITDGDLTVHTWRVLKCQSRHVEQLLGYGLCFRAGLQSSIIQPLQLSLI